MALGDLYQQDVDRSLSTMAALPPESAPKRNDERTAWGAPWRAVKAAAADVLGSTADVIKGYGAASAMTLEADPVARAALGDKAIQQGAAEGRRQIESGEALVSDVGRSFRSVSEEQRPDPATASKAEQIVFGVVRPVAKLVGGGLTMGPIGIGLASAEEGFTQSEDLRQQGVDVATRTKIGALTAVTNAVGAFLPMAGPTLKATAGLYLLGGPGAFMAQQQATRTILEHADYAELAKQYDPLDPTGLLLSSLIPLPFAAHGVVRNLRTARATRADGIEPAVEPPGATPAAPAVPRDVVDAAMVHNLTLQQDVRHTSVPDLAHPDTLRLPEAQRERYVEVYRQAAAVKPGFDAALGDIAATVGGTFKATPLKGTTRAVDKIVSDYGGDPGRIKDVVRGTIVVDSLDAARAAMEQLLGRFEVLPQGRRDWLDPSVQTPDGYRDAKFNVLIGGHVAEVQINLPQMLAAKKQAHPLYVEVERLRREAEARGDTEVPAHVLALQQQQRAIYDAAWTEATSARKPASVSGAPLRDAESTGNGRGAGGSQQMPSEGGTPAPTVTGMPSTSQNSQPGANLAGSRSTSDFGSMSASGSIIGENSIGRTAEVVTERGLTAPVRFRLVEATDLITSHTNDLTANPAFPAELQPRDRARTASADQIARIENALRPELLGESVKASDGAPIIGPDAVVESGNARTIALRRAYESGKADGYRTWLTANAERFGLTADQVAGMRRPVLVRERAGRIDRAEFARQANESTIAAMSPTEQARADAARITDLSGLHANEDGTINVQRSAGFLRQFLQRAVSPTERGALLQADGRLSQAGQQRLRNAIFAKAYGDANLVAMLAESTDSNVRNVLAGLMRAAPDVARLRDLIDAGARHPLDMAPDMVRAVQEFSKLRADGMTVEQFLAQGSLLDDGIPPELRALLTGLQENARSPRRIGEMVRQLVDAIDAMGDPRQAGLLDDATPTQADVASTTVERMRALSDEQITDTQAPLGKPATDPLLASIADRVAAVEATAGDMVVRTDGAGRPVTVAEELARVRREATEGTDVDLGAMDADLVRVAADCALAMGTA